MNANSSVTGDRLDYIPQLQLIAVSYIRDITSVPHRLEINALGVIEHILDRLKPVVPRYEKCCRECHNDNSRGKILESRVIFYKVCQQGHNEYRDPEKTDMVQHFIPQFVTDSPCQPGRQGQKKQLN